MTEASVTALPPTSGLLVLSPAGLPAVRRACAASSRARCGLLPRTAAGGLTRLIRAASGRFRDSGCGEDGCASTVGQSK